MQDRPGDPVWSGLANLVILHSPLSHPASLLSRHMDLLQFPTGVRLLLPQALALSIGTNDCNLLHL